RRNSRVFANRSWPPNGVVSACAHRNRTGRSVPLSSAITGVINLKGTETMKTISRIVLIAAGLALAPTLASADWQDNPHGYDAWMKARDHRQERRIDHGVQNGSLTRWEARRLDHRDHHLDRARHYAMRDGHIGPREYRHLNQA